MCGEGGVQCLEGRLSRGSQGADLEGLTVCSSIQHRRPIRAMSHRLSFFHPRLGKEL